MAKALSQAEVNHLRRLLGWVRGEVGQSPEELVSTMEWLAPRLGTISAYGQRAMVESHQKAERVPKYVRQAIKMLERAIKDEPGEIVDGEVMHNRLGPK